MQCIKKYQNQKVIITVLEKSSVSTVDINVLASVAEELLFLIATDYVTANSIQLTFFTFKAYISDN